jgi:hypothetical protein
MDSDTWNAYHILSNRARSVCYGARQQQFRALTQMTVNKLMASSSQQLGFIRELKVGFTFDFHESFYSIFLHTGRTGGTWIFGC